MTCAFGAMQCCNFGKQLKGVRILVNIPEH